MTKNSLDREWMFFEAGIACGRRALYAPLFFNVEPQRLPQTIGAYQGTPYNDEAKVLELVRAVAIRHGASVKRTFTNKYKTFVASVAEHLGLKRPSEDVGRERDLAYAVQLIFEDTDAARAILDNFAPHDPDLQKTVDLSRIQFAPGLSIEQRLKRLEEMPGVLSMLPAKLCRAQWEPAPHLALLYAQEVLTGVPDGPYIYTRAIEIATHRLKLLGRSGEAHALLHKTLRDPRRVVRARGALLLAEELPEQKRLGRATLAAFAIASNPDKDTFLAAARLVQGSGCPALSAYIAHLADSACKSAESAHWLGLAFLQPGTASAAYRALKRAADGGVQLAYVNMAGLFASGPVAGAGVELLAANQGPYHAASNKYPHETRAELEEAAQADETRASGLIARGEAHFAVLVAALDQTLKVTSTPGASSVTLSSGYESDDGRAYKVFALASTPSFVVTEVSEKEKKKGFMGTRDCPVPGISTLDGGQDGGLMSGADATMTVTLINEDNDQPSTTIEKWTPRPETAAAGSESAEPKLGLAGVLARGN
jgi:hypothetical protein